MTAKLYVEGAGQTDLERTHARQAFSKFFESAGIRRKPRVVASGGRTTAYDDFVIAISDTRGELSLLLVDAEDAVDPRDTAWQHLAKRDGWRRPNHATDEQVFLMVQVMETWFLADRELLRTFFGAECRTERIPQWQSLEAVHKSDVMKALEDATKDCLKKRYQKGKISFELLERLNPSHLERACPHAKRFLDRLRSL